MSLDPTVRGQGYGKRLMEHALEFCRDQSYETVILWTNRELEAARKIYARYGFEIMETKVSVKSNKELLEEKWARALS
jgi:GNAT superfamily N-acetyltransferase